MANGTGNGTINVLTRLVVPGSALALLLMLTVQVGKDASIALDVARQHGEELLLVNGKISLLEEDIRNRTQSRYTSTDAAKDLRYMQKDINACVKEIKEHKKNAH
jgi:hypothetical protein